MTCKRRYSCASTCETCPLQEQQVCRSRGQQSSQRKLSCYDRLTSETSADLTNRSYSLHVSTSCLLNDALTSEGNTRWLQLGCSDRVS